MDITLSQILTELYRITAELQAAQARIGQLELELARAST